METVVLIHGLWLGGWAMRMLAKRLRRADYNVVCMSYRTVRCSPKQNAEALYLLASEIKSTRIHFVAHSLGGIVVLKMLERYHWQHPGRIVMLGSPLMGSRKAKRLYRLPFGKRLLGQSVAQGLMQAQLFNPEDYEIGMIAGTAAIGIGLLLGPMAEPNDSTVAVSETQLPGLKATRLIHTSHTAMLINAQVAEEVKHFLKYGYFSSQ